MGIEHGPASPPAVESGGVTPGSKNCLFTGAPEATPRCKVGDLAALPGYRGDFEDLQPAAMPKAEEEVKTAQI